jgi:hypothetical protein
MQALLLELVHRFHGLQQLGYIAGLLGGAHPGLIQSLSQALLSGLRVWAEVGGIAPFLCLKAPLPQPIST